MLTEALRLKRNYIEGHVVFKNIVSFSIPSKSHKIVRGIMRRWTVMKARYFSTNDRPGLH